MRDSARRRIDRSVNRPSRNRDRRGADAVYPLVPRLGVLFLLGLVLACSEPAKEQSSPSSPGPICEAGEVERAREALSTWCEVGRFYTASQHDLATAPFPMPRVPERWVQPTEIVVRAGKLSNGFHHRTVDDFRRELRDYPVRTIRGERETVDGPWPWLLTITPETPAAALPPILEMLVDVGQPSGALLFAITPDPPLPLAPDRAYFDAIDQDHVSLVLGRDMEEVVRDSWCGQYRDSIESTFKASSRSGQCNVALETLPEAMAACGCRGDTDRMMTLMYANLVGIGDPTTVLVATPVTIDLQAEPIRGETWAELASKLGPQAVSAFNVGPSSKPDEPKPSQP